MNRRQMLLATGTGGLALATVGLETGCNAQQWLTVLENDLPTLIQIALNIAGIAAAAQGKGAISAAVSAEITGIGNDIHDGLTALQATVAAYNAADATARPGILGTIISGISAIQGNLQALMGAAHINDSALQATISGSIALALSTLLAIETLLPPAPAPVPAPASFPRARIAVRTANVRVANPKNTSLHQVLVASYNEVVKANGFSQFAI